jgi:hypothetical protein
MNKPGVVGNHDTFCFLHVAQAVILRVRPGSLGVSTTTAFEWSTVGCHVAVDGLWLCGGDECMRWSMEVASIEKGTDAGCVWLPLETCEVVLINEGSEKPWAVYPATLGSAVAWAWPWAASQERFLFDVSTICPQREYTRRSSIVGQS